MTHCKRRCRISTYLKEQEASQPTGHGESQFQSFDAEAINAALSIPAQPCRDQLFGIGHSYTLGQHKGIQLELYPEARVVRVTSSDARLELYRQNPPSLSPDRLVFSQQQHDHMLTLTVRSSGEVTLTLNDVSESPQRPSSLPNSVVPNVKTSETIEDNSRALQTHEEVPSPSSPKPVQDEKKQERLTLRGRVGTAVRSRKTSKGTLVAAFPLAIHNDEEETTTWIDVVAFNDRAKKILDLKRGQVVEVVGYLHSTEQPNREGKTAAVKKQIYSVVVKQL